MRPPCIGLPMTVTHMGSRVHWTLATAYAWAVETAGGVPVPIPPLGAGEALWRLYDNLDGLLLCGGGDLAPATYGAPDEGRCLDVVPLRDATELALARRALNDGLPVLGICRGLQVLNVAAGGTLLQDIAAHVPDALLHRTPPEFPRDHIAHTVTVEPGSLLGQLLQQVRSGRASPGVLAVNSTHHQAPERVGQGLRCVARAPDGVIEALESALADSFCLGVQWHPEELLASENGLHRELFRALVRRAAGLSEGQE